MVYSQPITRIITSRFSCRSYLAEPIEPEKQRRLQDFASTLQVGPIGTPVRFGLVAAGEQDRETLRGLGTYGFIQGPTGFLIGTMCPGAKNLEDYGYRLEQLVLLATDLNLGSCWLGGTFTKSSFARKISAAPEERLPAVASIGAMADPEQARQATLRRKVGADRRLPWDSLFFDERFSMALSREKAGAYAIPLDMVRWGPSASNKQPWRIVRDGNAWHFYLRRTAGYRESLPFRLLRLDDLQRVDMGIAMSHFELTANELGLKGKWIVHEPSIEKPDKMTEYTISWIASTDGESGRDSRS